MPAAFGGAPLRVTPDAALRWLKPGAPAFDPVLLSWVERFVTTKDMVWDIGANVGVFTIGSACRNAEVLAVEADPWLSSLLDFTIRHPSNRRLSVELLCAAIAGEVGTARLAIAQRGRASNFLQDYAGRGDAGGSRETRLVPVLTLDTLLHNHRAPSIVKIDVEGAEAAVLRGASDLLSTVRPTILVEVDDRTRDETVRMLHVANYVVMDSETGRPCDETPAQNSNLLAVPR